MTQQGDEGPVEVGGVYTFSPVHEQEMHGLTRFGIFLKGLYASRFFPLLYVFSDNRVDRLDKRHVGFANQHVYQAYVCVVALF